jgi:AAA family ATP:ADP antiporter
VLPAVYVFFALNLLAFAFELNPFVFFVWLSVFNLFVVSVFWSFMSDIFDTAQAARLYGSIAAGGSCGAIAGPLAASLFPDTTVLLLLSAALLLATIVCIVMLSRWARAHPRVGDPPAGEPLGGSILAGARAALTSPFLLAICGYLLCYTALSTALYFQQVEIVSVAVADPAERTRLFASLDLTVNSLTLVIQILAFSRLALLLGPAGMLALVPILSVLGFLWLGATPTLTALIAFGVTRRVGEFAISKPARETLFTIVPREERYKAKNFIDTVIYRGGDALAGWLFAAVSAFIAAAVALAWTGLAFFLGARMKSWTRDDARSSPRSLQQQR